MLRNTRPWPTASPTTILNEVLSLNAQEFHPTHSIMNMPDFLNEVLSLNAQEFLRVGASVRTVRLLNEVLSLNAQESQKPAIGDRYGIPQ